MSKCEEQTIEVSLGYSCGTLFEKRRVHKAVGRAVAAGAAERRGRRRERVERESVGDSAALTSEANDDVGCSAAISFLLGIGLSLSALTKSSTESVCVMSDKCSAPLSSHHCTARRSTATFSARAASRSGPSSSSCVKRCASDAASAALSAAALSAAAFCATAFSASSPSDPSMMCREA